MKEMCGHAIVPIMSLIDNKKALFDYTVLEELEAGIELRGTEVKSIRMGLGSLKGARVVARGGEAYLVSATIPPWQIANAGTDYDPERPRRLLLNAKEIAHVASAEGQKGLTIVPLSLYSKSRRLKLSIAIVRGKKQHDKRETIRNREVGRKIAREMKE
jgi:SsrA-binding protein